MSELYPPAIGGSAVLFANVYRRLGRELGVRVLTDAETSPDAGKAGIEDEIEIVRGSLRTARWGLLHPAGLRHHLRVARRIRSLAREADPGPSIVHAGRPLPEGLAAWLASKLGGPRYVAWAHGEDIATALTSRELGYLVRRIYRRAAAALANSRSTARLIEALGVPSERIQIAHPGVDPDRFRPEIDGFALRKRLAPDAETLLLQVGRLQRRKGHDLAIEAVARLRDELPGLRFLIVGDGDQRERLESLATERGVADRVIFAGSLDDAELPACYAASDVFIHPNRDDGGDIEGFGIVFLEAAATERPSIGGNTGGVPEAVADGETGLLVSGEDADELAAAIRRLAGDAELRARLGKAGRERVLAGFTWEHTARHVGELHDRLLGTGS